MRLMRRLVIATATAGVVLAPMMGALAADTPSGLDPDRGCVYNGQIISFDGDVAPAPACWRTPDDPSIPVLAEVDPSRTESDLLAVQTWSPLDPDHYVARGTMADRVIPADAPVAPNSDEIAASVGPIVDHYISDQFKGWFRTAYNVDGGFGPGDNIPIYVVDSSNPHQEFATFTSADARVTTNAGVVRVNTGKIPLPGYAKPSSGGDKALAIYDVATGIWRSYFHATEQADGTWAFASGGYWYGDQASLSAGENYSLGLVQGSSSVVGISNELTQIGVEELVRGEIGHMVSVTFPSYSNEGPSFPAKQTDGRLSPEQFPNAPKAGQVFRFPPDFDVDAYADEHNIDASTRAIMNAVKKHGGIIADQNAWITAFNIESPLGYPEGMAPHHTPEGSAALSRLRLNTFPWHETQWMVENYAGVGDNAGQQEAMPMPGAEVGVPVDPEPEDPTDPVDPDPEPEVPEPTEPPVEPVNPEPEVPADPDPEPEAPDPSPEPEVPAEPSPEPEPNDPTETAEPVDPPTSPASPTESEAPADQDQDGDVDPVPGSETADAVTPALPGHVSVHSPVPRSPLPPRAQGPVAADRWSPVPSSLSGTLGPESAVHPTVPRSETTDRRGAVAVAPNSSSSPSEGALSDDPRDADRDDAERENGQDQTEVALSEPSSDPAPSGSVTKPPQVVQVTPEVVDESETSSSTWRVAGIAAAVLAAVGAVVFAALRRRD